MGWGVEDDFLLSCLIQRLPASFLPPATAALNPVVERSEAADQHVARLGVSGLYRGGGGGGAHPGQRLDCDVGWALTLTRLDALALVGSGSRLALAPGRLLRASWELVGCRRRDGAVLGGWAGLPAEVVRCSDGLVLTATRHHSTLM